MLNLIFKRILKGIAVVAGVAVVVFVIFRALPGDPVKMILGTHYTEDTAQELRKELHLDKRLGVQLYYHLKDFSVISIEEDSKQSKQKYNYTMLFHTSKNSVLVIKKPYFGRSYQTNKLVSDTLMESMEGTLWLALTSMLIATFFGIIFGILAAINYQTWIDNSLVTLSVIGISTPSFVAAILISMVFGYYLTDITGLNMQGYFWEKDIATLEKKWVLKNLILPSITLGIRPLAIIMQLTRSSMLDVLSQDYIRTARAKGLSFIQVVLKHALKNALNPVITAVSGWLASLMTGAFFVEYIFNWRGLGYTIIQAIEMRDLPIVMGGAIVIAIIFVIISTFVDIVYALLDPRVRLDN